MNKPQIDKLTIHSDDLGEVVGMFYGTPVHAWYESKSEEREKADARKRIAFNRVAEEQHVSA